MSAENHSGDFEKLVKELQVKRNCHFPEVWRGIFLLFFEAGILAGKESVMQKMSDDTVLLDKADEFFISGDLWEFMNWLRDRLLGKPPA